MSEHPARAKLKPGLSSSPGTVKAIGWYGMVTGGGNVTGKDSGYGNVPSFNLTWQWENGPFIGNCSIKTSIQFGDFPSPCLIARGFYIAIDHES